ncbi:replication fork protection component Swi3-domain-containing protein [Melampsora americana]|nr:replication fork protection component Swi3-domain-containing protein [Melampsora americana]
MSSDIQIDGQEQATSRRDAPRFLGDGLDDEDNDNIDALFENLDDADEFALPAPIDHEAMAASLAQKSIQRVNPFAAPNGDDPLAGGDGDGTKSTRIRRPTVKLDEDRLLNHPDGFQKLISLAKAFKAGPKGSEKEDLGRVLKMYRMWAHVLHPKARFRDAIDTIEKLCHKRPLQSALNEWRGDAFQNSKKRKTTSNEVQVERNLTVGRVEPTEQPASPNQSVTRPLFRRPEEDIDDFDMDQDEDFDKLLQEMDVSGSAPITNGTSIPRPLFAPDPDDEFAEEEALMRELEENAPSTTPPAAPRRPSTNDLSILPTVEQANLPAPNHTSIPPPLFVPDPDEEFAEEEAIMREQDEDALRTTAHAVLQEPSTDNLPTLPTCAEKPTLPVPNGTSIAQPLFVPDPDEGCAEDEALMKDYEQETAPAVLKEVSTNSLSTLPASIEDATKKMASTDTSTGGQNVDHDWDDLYT